MKLTLLVRAYCHLCDEMADALAPIANAAGAVVEIVDIDAPGLEHFEEAWGERVPALFVGDPATGLLVCGTRLDAERLLAVLDDSRGVAAAGR